MPYIEREHHYVTHECGCKDRDGDAFSMCVAHRDDALRRTHKERHARRTAIINEGRRRQRIASAYYATCSFMSPTPYSDEDLQRHERIHNDTLRNILANAIIKPFRYR